MKNAKNIKRRCELTVTLRTEKLGKGAKVKQLTKQYRRKQRYIGQIIQGGEAGKVRERYPENEQEIEQEN